MSKDARELALDATAHADPALDATVGSAPGIAPPMTVASMAQRDLGRRLGRFTLVETLGAGAMGVVYRAEDPELGRNVALKLLHRPDSELAQRLVREARAMAQINHPNVVTIYDVGVAEGTTYIAMELVVGTSLRAWQSEPRSIPAVIEHYLGAGRGLAAAHASGLIHRDFKPDNVLVGADGRVRVSDFGLAASHSSGSSGDPGGAGAGTAGAGAPRPTELSLTATGTYVGTPAYMAPEQLERGNVDSRTDQFAFSVALHEALYGARPFAGRSFRELGDAITAGRVPPPPPRTRVSAALRRIVLRGLAVKPGDRYPTMDHLLADLARDRARPWRRVAYATTVLAMALAIGLAADTVARDRLAHETREAFRRTGKETQLAVDLLAGTFLASSDVAFVAPWMLEVSATHRDAEFGLGTDSEDSANQLSLHESLASADWQGWSVGTGLERIQAVTDRTGALLFTTADRTIATGDLTTLPFMHVLLAGSKTTTRMAVLPNDLPALVQSRVLGAADPHGISVVFGRSITPGDVVGAIHLQFADGQRVLSYIRTDDESLELALVTPEGRYVPASVPAPLAAVAGAGISEVRAAGKTYQVQSKSIVDSATGAPIARLVMARQVDSLLSGLFPHARAVFAAALLAALALAAAMTLRARSLAR